MRQENSIGPARLDSIDFLKAAAIIAVVFTHAGPMRSSPAYTTADLLLRQSWVSFHVPIFLLVAGFLYARSEPIPLRKVASRLQRLLVPYVIACAVLWTSGVAPVSSVRDAAFQLLSGSVLGIYYFVFLLTWFTLLIWPLSRISPRWLPLLIVAVLGYEIVCCIFPPLRLRFRPMVFWSMRNPLDHFIVGYFLVGWTVSLYRREFAAFYRRYRVLCWVLAAVGVAIWANAVADEATLCRRSLSRVVYSLSACAIISMATLHARAPSIVRFLSGATLTIYLYHHIAHKLMMPYAAHWPALLRILVLAAGAVGAAAALAWLGQRLLGKRSHLLLGS